MSVSGGLPLEMGYEARPLLSLYLARNVSSSFRRHCLQSLLRDTLPFATFQQGGALLVLSHNSAESVMWVGYVLFMPTLLSAFGSN